MGRDSEEGCVNVSTEHVSASHVVCGADRVSAALIHLILEREREIGGGGQKERQGEREEGIEGDGEVKRG